MTPVEPTDGDLECGGAGGHRRSGTGSYGNEGSPCFSDADDVGSTYSQFYSTAGDDYSFAGEIAGNGGVDSRRVSSEFSVDVNGGGGGGTAEVKVNLGKVDRECRICHLGMESGSSESGMVIELGCCCKDDLGFAHKHCAETWFKIKGNKTCEICNSIARNVVGANEADSIEQANENTNTAAATEPPASAPSSETTRRFWNGHKLLNFLLACMVLAFVISWLFHFSVPS